MTRAGFVAACLVLFFASSSGRAETTTDGRLWGALIGQGSAGLLHPELEKWRWWLEGQVRARDDFGTFDQSVVRTGVGYTVFPKTAVWLGYGWFRTSPEGDSDFDEHRIWQQLTWSKGLGPFALATRTRLEQRFLDTGDDTGWRFRQWVKLTIPLWKRLDFPLWNEVFVNFNDTDWGADGGFDQNRFFAGAGLGIDQERHVRFEIGYLNQFISNSGGPDSMNHILSLNLLLNY